MGSSLPNWARHAVRGACRAGVHGASFVGAVAVVGGAALDEASATVTGVEPAAAGNPLDATSFRYQPGTGLVITSRDGQFMMAPRLRIQYRYTAENETGSDAQQSLQLRRARLQFKGHVFGKHNGYKAEFAFSPSDVGQSDGGSPSTSPMLDWYFDFTHYRDLSVRVGQWKLGHNRQRVISSGDLQLVDRSIVNGEFTVDRDVGVELRSQDLWGLSALRYSLGAFAGEGRNTRGLHDFDMLYLARLEWLPFGLFKDYEEADLEHTRSPRLSIGASYVRLLGAKGVSGILGAAPEDGGTTDIHGLEADLMFKMSGFSCFSEWMYRDGSRNPGDATMVDSVTGAETAVPVQAPRNGFGGMLQAGYLLPGLPLEVAARFALVRPVGDDSSLGERDEMGGGLSYYFAGHPFKLQADYFRIVERADGTPDVHTHQFRVQLQAAY